MIAQNKKINIEEELERSNQSRQAARLLALADGNLINDAISRLYYFAFHAVRALLLTKGLQPKSHEGAVNLLSRHFVKEKVLPGRVAHILSRLLKYREQADYSSSYVFAREDFEQFQAEAEELFSTIVEYLKQEGHMGRAKK